MDSSYERHAAARSARDTPPRHPITRAPAYVTNPAELIQNSCRKAKIRCIGAEHPPCERCKAAGYECVLEKPPAKDPPAGVEARLQQLEDQMTSMHELLHDVVRAVRPREEMPRPDSQPAETSGPSTGGIITLPSGRPSSAALSPDTRTYRAPRFWHPSPDAAREVEKRPLERSPSHEPVPVELSPEGELMTNPLGGMSNMAERVEALQGRERPDARLVKKARRHAEWSDPLSLGLISLEEALTIFDIFFSGCSEFINCYDPDRDTFPSLSERSSFSLTAVMYVGARVRDGGEPPSEIQLICYEHTQKMAMRSLCHPRNNIEDVKALVLLAAFSENGWLIAGHAVRMAQELGLDKAFPELVRSGMGQDKSPAELELDRPLVDRARVWLTVYRLEHQMSYGLGRPAIVREDSTIHNCRLLLDHPLTMDADIRLVYAVELLCIRAPLHVDLTAAPDQPLDAGTLERLRWANEQFDAWERHWDAVLTARYGSDGTGFVRESLTMQRQLAELFINSQLLRGVHCAEDIDAMSPEKRELALRAMHNALRCVDICLRGRDYSKGMAYGTHHTHVCAAFAASFLIRIGRFFPDELDLAGAVEDAEQTADILARIPAIRYARSLRLILRKARHDGLLPPRRREPEPAAWLPDFATVGEQPIPLFLNEPAVGAGEMPFVGLEDFFLPAELEHLLSTFDPIG